MNEKNELLIQILQQVEVLISRIPKKSDKRFIIPIGIFLTIFDLSNDIVILLNKGRRVSGTIILRNLVESMNSLFLLEKDINFIYSLL